MYKEPDIRIGEIDVGSYDSVIFKRKDTYVIWIPFLWGEFSFIGNTLDEALARAKQKLPKYLEHYQDNSA